MGIRNIYTTQRVPQTSWLITPSWGFGTRILLGRFDGQILLITPHGDSERTKEAFPEVNLNSHNPSWGFGTNSGRRRGTGVRVLITPHGDSELRVHIAPTVAVPSHNPSWGFGTTPVGHTPCKFCHS